MKREMRQQVLQSNWSLVRKMRLMNRMKKNHTKQEQEHKGQMTHRNRFPNFDKNQRRKILVSQSKKIGHKRLPLVGMTRVDKIPKKQQHIQEQSKIVLKMPMNRMIEEHHHTMGRQMQEQERKMPWQGLHKSVIWHNQWILHRILLLETPASQAV